jgi:hypothetical protein
MSKDKLSGTLHEHPEIRKYIKNCGFTSVPRKVNTAVKVSLFFGEKPGFIGMLIIVLTIAFLYAGIEDEFHDLFSFSSVERTKGNVVNIAETNVSINDRTIVIIDYKYTLNDLEYTGYSYMNDFYPKIGSSINVEYVPDTPGLSRIEGGSYSVLGRGSLVLFAIYVILFVLFVFYFLKSMRRIRLLKEGSFSMAKLEEMKETIKSVNYQKVMKLTYSFVQQGERKQYIIKTHEISNLTDEAEEILLFDPTSRKKVIGMLIDELPANLSIKEEGNGVWILRNSSLSFIFILLSGLFCGLFFAIFIIGFLG